MQAVPSGNPVDDGHVPGMRTVTLKYIIAGGR